MKKTPNLFQRNSIAICLLIFISLIILITRRGAQLFSPHIWDEDGVTITPHGGLGNIPGFLENSWLSLFEPVNGYLLFIPKIITGISLNISFIQYPIISTIIAWIFIIYVVCMVATANTMLNGKPLLALLILCLPTDPEVIGIPLYTFWWASILLFLVPFWMSSDEKIGKRFYFLTIGGLSSPAILLILPTLFIRIFIFKNKAQEIYIFIWAFFFGLIQSLLIFRTSSNVEYDFVAIAKSMVPIFFGNFLLGSFTSDYVSLFLAGLILLSSIIIGLWVSSSNYLFLTFLYLIFGSIALTIARVDISLIHPALSGPRYFFFPFIFTMWCITHIAFTNLKIRFFTF